MPTATENESLLLIATTGVAVLSVATLGFWWWSRGRPRRKPVAPAGKSLEHRCENCSRTMIFARADLSELSPGEVGLVVRSKPEWIHRKLADMDCPYCGASHCFATDRNPMEFVGCDIYTPQAGAGRCLDCRKPLAAPPWPAGTYDGRIQEVPELRAEFGLVCERCQAVCCVACCEKATRGRTGDGSLLCPRCFRGPLTTIYNP